MNYLKSLIFLLGLKSLYLFKRKIIIIKTKTRKSSGKKKIFHAEDYFKKYFLLFY